MKIGLITGIAGTVTVTFAGCAGSGTADEKKPNIIFIIADDLGYNDLGCYGQKIIETPNVDALAANGIRFTNYYSGSPVSAPSRCVFLPESIPGTLLYGELMNGRKEEMSGTLKKWKQSAP